MSTPEEAGILSRPESARAANDRIAVEARRQHFVSRLPLLCECSDSECRDLVLIGAGAYEDARRDWRNFLTAPCHRLENATVFSREGEYWVQRRGVALD